MQRKYFGTDGIRGRVGQFPITPDFVLKLGWAAGRVFSKVQGRKGNVLVGKDTRISGYMFESALEAGLAAAGVNCCLLGPMPTPAISYLTRTLHAQAGIVISASHNAYEDNGIKFFSGEGTKLPDNLELDIERQIEEPLTSVIPEEIGKASRIVDAAGRYIEFCKSTVGSRLSFRPLKIVIDCANGATYHIAPSVCRELDAEVIELAADPDGFNINENCGSTHPDMLRRMVVAEGADIGLAFDGDGDRVILVDHQGEVVDGDEILFILATDWQRKNKLAGGVVGTVMSNYGLEVAFRERGIDFTRAKVGDRYVMDELLSKGWSLGGETSGHVICLNKTLTGDGIITALQVLSIMVEQNKSLRELKQGMQKLPQKLINVKIAQKISQLHCEPTIQIALKRAEQKLNQQGRVLLRSSGTEPVIRVMVEGVDVNLVTQIAEELAEIVEKTWR
ncbi:MAG: phosphoglucosamine mutase [Gammaproteobacteria bacterium GWE2_42_36]|nr:MAG: phosphoglucosamine mutase [Gammaproteobacteria bacterium GWE2_42_36]